MSIRTTKYLLTLFFITGLHQMATAQANYRKIENYKPFYGWAHHFPQDWMILRQFENEGREYYMLVNPQTLETQINECSFYQVKPMSIAQARVFFKSTPY